jgi:pimeloyl-ACP methyl ester carboxylesterase
MHHFMFLAGPPAGQRMWDSVLARIHDQGAVGSAVDLSDLRAETEDPAGWATALAHRMQDVDGCILVAHGTAVPLARHAAVIHPPAGLVLSNGPLGPVSRPLRALCTAARSPGSRWWARPRLAIPWLASSAGLRRTVVNPYVWDRDTVVTVCGPLFEVPALRERTLRFLGSLPEMAASAPTPTVPTALLWGGSDPFFPALHQSFSLPDSKLKLIDGGHHYHPLERPWETADGVLAWAQKTLTTT